MVIKNVIICDVNGERSLDIEIVENIVTQIGENITSSDYFDAKGAYLLPTLVDLNVRVKDSSLNSKSIDNLAYEAKKGGVGRVVLVPDSTPSISDEITLEFVQKHGSEECSVEIECAISAINDEGNLSNIAILLKNGALGPYVKTTTNNNLVSKIAQYTQMYNKTLFVKAEDKSLSSDGVMNEGERSVEFGLSGVSELSEILHVSRMIEIAKFYNIDILFKSIATPRSIELITQAKKDGVKVKCEVSIHHLLFSDEKCADFNQVAKLDPPLTSKDRVEKLLLALSNSEIDILTTLHQDSSLSAKDVAFVDASYGCSSIAHALPLYYTKLVKSGVITMSKLLQLCVQNPSLAIGENRGTIEVGTKASFTLFDPTKTTEVKDTHSLYNSELLSGKIIQGVL
ncbi:MAG: amidohydrolase family protein [Helicobacteraceae bacterium]|nr:amidohydrolase family protein [Helicobacteraceae bacterium]